MKLLLLLLPFLLLSVIITLPTLSLSSSSSAAPAEAPSASPPAVRDTDGNIIQTDLFYYIVPFNPTGSGLKNDGYNRLLCPTHIVETGFEVQDGYPVRFYPIDGNKTVFEGIDFNVKFLVEDIFCHMSTVWTFESLPTPEDPLSQYVTVGGVIGNPGSSTLTNWFNIVRASGSRHGESPYYKLRYCPSMCEICAPMCADIGESIEMGQRWLRHNATDFPVVFQKF